jgi:hypothetical protein
MYRALLDKTDIGLDKSGEELESQTKDEIDNVFIQIRDIYNEHHISIILNILELMKKNTIDYESYIEAMNAALRPSHSKIQKWIHQHIIL